MIKLNNKGFSLVELIVVVAILGVMAALVIPKMNTSRDGASLKAAVREVVTNIRYTRDQAITMGVEYQIKFNVDEKTYSLRKYDSIINDFKTEQDFRLPDGITTKDKNTWITFAVTGNPNPSKTNNYNFTLDNGVNQEDVIVGASTGSARIE